MERRTDRGESGGQLYHLAQVNTPRLKFPLDSPEMADFVGLIEEVNAEADASEGFVWRQEHPSLTEAHNIFNDPNLIVNLSVWTSVRGLQQYFRSASHVEAFRRRDEWFVKGEGVTMALWWVRAGHLPTIGEAEGRIVHLRDHGPTDFAFNFGAAKNFPAPAG